MTAQDYTSPSSQRQYRMLFKVGRGGMGDVHLALATGHGAFRKLVVLKCRRPTSGDETDRRGMFLEEGRLAALLNHPNIVQTHEVGQLAGTDYIAMEFLEGQPVSQLSAQAGGLAPRLVAHIAEQVLRGLEYAQELRDLDGSPLNIIHRDLSPENIFITYDGAVKVLDFGIAKSDARSREVTEAGVLKGKLSYMAPEQVETFTADRRTDIFVLGMVMWELVTGKRLNSHRSAVDQFRWLTEGKVPSLMTLTTVDPELDAIIQTACQRKPQSRYATAQEMRSALEAFLSRTGGGGAAEHLSRVMASHFGRVRDSMRVQVRRRIREMEHEAAEPSAHELEDTAQDRASEITYVVQNSDLFSGDDNYRSATTGRVVVPRRRPWAGWLAASCLSVFCVGWFHYARTVGAESVVFRVLPQSAPAASPAQSWAAGSHSPIPHYDAAPLVPALPVNSTSATSLGPAHQSETLQSAVSSSSPPVQANVSESPKVQLAVPSATPAETAVAKPVATPAMKPNVPKRIAFKRAAPLSKVNTETVQSLPRQELSAPQVDEMLPARVPMVN